MVDGNGTPEDPDAKTPEEEKTAEEKAKELEEVQ